jgi:hypothetical protein
LIRHQIAILASHNMPPAVRLSHFHARCERRICQLNRDTVEARSFSRKKLETVA